MVNSKREDGSKIRPNSKLAIFSVVMDCHKKLSNTSFVSLLFKSFSVVLFFSSCMIEVEDEEDDEGVDMSRKKNQNLRENVYHVNAKPKLVTTITNVQIHPYFFQNIDNADPLSSNVKRKLGVEKVILLT